MYSLRPYTADFVVKPVPVIYNLPSYHKEEAEVTSCLNGDVVLENKAVKPQNEKSDQQSSETCNEISNHQKTILVKLSGLEKRLDALFVTKGTSDKKSAKPQDKKVVEKPQNDKKAQKVGDGIKRSQEGKSTSVVVENSPKLLYASLVPTCSVFPIHDYGSEKAKKEFYGQILELSYPPEHVKWVKALMELAPKTRGIDFGSTCKQDSVVIQTKENSKDLLLKLPNNKEVKDILAIWKFFGTLFGLYYELDGEISTLTAIWLYLAIAEDLDALTRKLSSHLSRFDFLSCSNAVTLADIIIRSLFNDTANGDKVQWNDVNIQNNVQLWIKRVDESIKAHKHS